MRFICAVMILLLLCLPTISQKNSEKKSTAMLVPLPPVANGGLSSLWYHDHKFILDEYGKFDLLNYKNAGFKGNTDSLTALSWKMLAMGDFLRKDVSYATLARVKNRPDGILLIMFQWHDPTDSSRLHGVHYKTFIGKEKLLLRTKQCTTGGVDTLEFSCGDLKRRCGLCYFDGKKGKMVLKITDKE